MRRCPPARGRHPSRSPRGPPPRDSGSTIVSTAASNGTVTHITGKLNSKPSANYLVEFLSSPSCDPSGNGEGKVFVGRTTVTTGQAGTGNFNVVLQVASKVGSKVTATATTPGGSTSEFVQVPGSGQRILTASPRTLTNVDEDRTVRHR